jgi:hypothetical protein
VDPVDLLPFSSAASLFAGKAGLAPLAPQDLVVLKFRSTQRTNLNLRSCLLLRRGCLSETDFSEAKTPGWWLLHGGNRKFLRDDKIIAMRRETLQQALKRIDTPVILTAEFKAFTNGLVHRLRDVSIALHALREEGGLTPLLDAQVGALRLITGECAKYTHQLTFDDVNV